MNINDVIVILHSEKEKQAAEAVCGYMQKFKDTDVILVSERAIYKLNLSTPNMKMRNLLKRFKPKVCACMCPGLLARALKTRGENTQIVSVITDNSVYDRNMAALNVDSYLVENEQCERELLEFFSVPSTSITVTGSLLIDGAEKAGELLHSLIK